MKELHARGMIVQEGLEFFFASVLAVQPDVHDAGSTDNSHFAYSPRILGSIFGAADSRENPFVFSPWPVDPPTKLLPPYTPLPGSQKHNHDAIVLQSFFERSKLYRGTKIGFCVIWGCISSSASSKLYRGREIDRGPGCQGCRVYAGLKCRGAICSRSFWVFCAAISLVVFS